MPLDLSVVLGPLRLHPAGCLHCNSPGLLYMLSELLGRSFIYLLLVRLPYRKITVFSYDQLQRTLSSTSNNVVFMAIQTHDRIWPHVFGCAISEVVKAFFITQFLCSATSLAWGWKAIVQASLIFNSSYTWENKWFLKSPPESVTRPFDGPNSVTYC